jgi:hypothetical protein
MGSSHAGGAHGAGAPGRPALAKPTAEGACCGLEVIAMTTAMHIKARITQWDDRALVQAFEHARDSVHQEDAPDGARAGARVQHLLREAGYPDARVEVIQTVDEKLRHTSHWLVSRDG